MVGGGRRGQDEACSGRLVATCAVYDSGAVDTGAVDTLVPCPRTSPSLPRLPDPAPGARFTLSAYITHG